MYSDRQARSYIMFSPIGAQPMGSILQTSYGKKKKPGKLGKLKKQGPPPSLQVAR